MVRWSGGRDSNDLSLHHCATWCCPVTEKASDRTQVSNRLAEKNYLSVLRQHSPCMMLGRVVFEILLT